MPIIRSSEQISKSLEDFYKDLVPKVEDTFGDNGTPPMLNVLEVINKLFKETLIYGFTSHSTLLLMEEDNSISDWFVAINGYRNEYHVEYIIPKEKSLWENVKIKGETTSLKKLYAKLEIETTDI
ncbi:hypothetical protein [Chryseobacterium paludis]|uniref:hypothetical protein n=1 Tax=Chryseobacterium paludis TaxID=2956784 RepID=UPI0021BF937B|nr:hypothetical protein [Chryseobacterium paludis]